jgi:2-keto-4-pentenoate hydratase/2-oxohepta-3-ene-1,7-dioic acid hydratase in catechol pathway
MKIVRFKAGEDIAYGLADSDGVTVYQGSPLFAWEATETVVPWDQVHLLAPVLPSKIVTVDNNFLDLDAEGLPPQEPVISVKPATSVTGPNTAVVFPPSSQEVTPQASLAVVVGRLARGVRAEDASQYLFGYTAANDVFASDLAVRDGHTGRARAFDTFLPLGPAVETELDPLERLAIIGRVDGEVRQAGFTSDMVFGVGELLEFISSVMTLLPGDVILTGTPPGAKPVVPGEVIETEIDGIGTLMNRLIRP